jgi:hypothetical protein
MNTEEQSIKVFTGTELQVNLLKEELENAGIGSMINSDFHSGISAGFGGGYPSEIELLIQKKDFQKAESIIKEFLKTNKD